MQRTPIQTGDGSYTLKVEALNECYHSLRGAVQEAEEVYLESGLAYYASLYGPTHLHIFEMGFGTGLNAWLAYQYAIHHNISIHYTAIEKYPLPPEEALSLGYSSDSMFLKLHSCAWNEQQSINSCFVLHKIQADLSHYVLSQNIDIIYFDAFAPSIQPELWCPEVFTKMYQALKPCGILLTYSAKGSVKEALRSAGFQVQRLKGSGGKRHMVRAVKTKS